jgi:hypothetical protein
VITGDGEFLQVGGPPCFCSVLGFSLGFPVEVITEIGFDFPDELVSVLDSLRMRVKKRSSYPTTRFVLDYRHEPRRMKVPAICEPLKIAEVDDIERLLLCPITSEISDELMLAINPCFLALDPQGLVRDIRKDHLVAPREWHNLSVLGKLDLLKTSSNEHHLITGTIEIKPSLRKLINLGVDIAVITDGSNGSYVMTDSDFFRVPVYPVELVDPTGAGDVFIAGLAAFLDEGLEWACSVAAASSSAIVETHGPAIRCNKSLILERTEHIHENLERLD